MRNQAFACIFVIISTYIIYSDIMFFMNDNDIVRILKKRRKELGMTQVQLAKVMNVSCQYISQIETGVRTPMLSTFLRLCEALDLEIELIDTTKK